MVFQCEVPDVPGKPLYEESVVGIDADVKSFVWDSDGHEIENPKFLAKKPDRLKSLHKSLPELPISKLYLLINIMR